MLGSTTHISVLDSDGNAASVTCSNGTGSGVLPPGTGVHLNNMLGEEDLNPLGFHLHDPGTRVTSMMAPTVVLRDGEIELALGSAGSNRLRSAITQVIRYVVDYGLPVDEAVRRERMHHEAGVLHVEGGFDERRPRRAGAPRLPAGALEGSQPLLRRHPGRLSRPRHRRAVRRGRPTPWRRGGRGLIGPLLQSARGSNPASVFFRMNAQREGGIAAVRPAVPGLTAAIAGLLSLALVLIAPASAFGAGWLAPGPSRAPGADSAQVAMAPDGTVVAAWKRGSRIEATVRPAGGGFGAAAFCSPDDGQASDPQVAIGASGVAAVVWVRQLDADHRPRSRPRCGLPAAASGPFRRIRQVSR